MLGIFASVEGNVDWKIFSILHVADWGYSVNIFWFSNEPPQRLLLPAYIHSIPTCPLPWPSITIVT